MQSNNSQFVKMIKKIDKAVQITQTLIPSVFSISSQNLLVYLEF